MRRIEFIGMEGVAIDTLQHARDLRESDNARCPSRLKDRCCPFLNSI